MRTDRLCFESLADDAWPFSGASIPAKADLVVSLRVVENGDRVAVRRLRRGPPRSTRRPERPRWQGLESLHEEGLYHEEGWQAARRPGPAKGPFNGAIDHSGRKRTTHRPLRLSLGASAHAASCAYRPSRRAPGPCPGASAGNGSYQRFGSINVRWFSELRMSTRSLSVTARFDRSPVRQKKFAASLMSPEPL